MQESNEQMLKRQEVNISQWTLNETLKSIEGGKAHGHHFRGCPKVGSEGVCLTSWAQGLQGPGAPTPSARPPHCPLGSGWHSERPPVPEAKGLATRWAFLVEFFSSVFFRFV